MNVGIVMYPWETIKVSEDSTLRIINEAVVRGHKTSLIYHENLTIRDTKVYAFSKTLKVANKPSTDMFEFYNQVELEDEMLEVKDFDVIFLRSNPPIDNVMLNFFDSVKKDVFIVNDIDGLRKASNKVYPATLAGDSNKYIPATHVSNNIKYLKKVINESDDDKLIMKPIDGYGGSGVIILEKTAKKNINSLLEFYIHRDNKENYIIIQEFAEGAEDGDVRVLMINGKPVGAMRRKPAADDARSNVHAGGSVVHHELSKHEIELCNTIGKNLVEDGLFFVGLDIIGGKLIEVNVLSPGGIPWVNENMGICIQGLLMDFAEEKVKELFNK